MKPNLPVAALALALAWPLAAPAEMNKADTQRFRDLARANLAEVEAGKLARERASSDAVKRFARHMVDDHGKMLDEHRSLAKKENVTLPREPGKAQQDAMRKLRDERGLAFDRAYMEQMVKEHQASLRLARDVAKNARDPQLRAAAEKAVPEIRKHLEMARQVHAASKNAGTGASSFAR